MLDDRAVCDLCPLYQSYRMKGLYALVTFTALHLSNFLNQQPIVADSCQVKAELVGELRGYPTPQASGQVSSGAYGKIGGQERGAIYRMD